MIQAYVAETDRHYRRTDPQVMSQKNSGMISKGFQFDVYTS